MLISRLVLGGLLLASSLISHAQATDPVPALHFYGGLGVYSSSHHNLSSWGSGARIPVQALVGYQWRPRLAVQLGFAYSGNRSEYAYSTSYSSSYPSPPNTVIDVAGTSTERSTTTSLLARYTLTRKLVHRFQADVLGGIKFEYSRYRESGTRTTYDQAAPVVTPFGYPSTYTSALLSIGPSLRYRVVSRLEVVYDLTFDFPIIGGKYSNSIYSTNRRSQSTMALGVRYRFGPS